MSKCIWSAELREATRQTLEKRELPLCLLKRITGDGRYEFGMALLFIPAIYKVVDPAGKEELATYHSIEELMEDGWVLD